MQLNLPSGSLNKEISLWMLCEYTVKSSFIRSKHMLSAKSNHDETVKTKLALKP